MGPILLPYLLDLFANQTAWLEEYWQKARVLLWVLGLKAILLSTLAYPLCVRWPLWWNGGVASRHVTPKPLMRSVSGSRSAG